MNRRIFATGAVLALALTPLAAASWISHGNVEPSTRYDSTDVMWENAPDGAGPQIYFNAFETHQAASSQNPNAGTLGTRVRPFPAAQWDAMFGLWLDCNGDGYVGQLESAVQEYRAELLTSDDVCPAGSSPHNDGEWVFEYLIFGAQDPCVWATEAEREAGSGHACEGFITGPSRTPGVIPVNDTFAWGQLGRPDRLVAPPGTCALTPLPKGTTSSTGMMLRYAECNAGVATFINTVDGAAGLGLGFDDPQNPHKSDSPLNQGIPVNLYGNPVEGQAGQTGLIEQDNPEDADDVERAFTTWDCSGEPIAVADPTGGAGQGVGVESPVEPIADPTGGEEPIDPADEDGHLLFHVDLADEDGNVVSVAPAPAVGNPAGSYWESARAAYEGATLHNPIQGNNDVDEFGGDCDPETATPIDGNNGAGFVDSPNEGTTGTPGRTHADFQVAFLDVHGCSLATGCALGFDFVPVDALGNAPQDGGVSGMRFWTGASWVGTPNLVTGTPGTGFRTDLAPDEPEYYSFYAAVDVAQASLKGWRTPNALVPLVYGGVQCPTIGNADGEGDPDLVFNGWACDPDDWNKDANGVSTATVWTDGTRVSRVVGDVYHLADVDCFDNRVTGDVRAGLYAPCE